MKKGISELEPHSNPLVQLSEAFEAVGAEMYSDKFLGRVLAWAQLSQFCEACVLNPALQAVLIIAARRFKLQGGCVPDKSKLMEWKIAMIELAAADEENDWLPADWLPELMERFRIDDGWQRIPYYAHFNSEFAHAAFFKGV